MKTARLLAVVGWLVTGSAAIASDSDTQTTPAQPVYESSIGGVVSASQLPGAAGQGYLVYNKWCAGCHAPNYAPKDPSIDVEKLSPVSRFALGTNLLQQRYQGALPAALEQRKDLTEAVINFYVRHGLNAMPAFRKTEISDAELKALVAYLARN
jgi:mono/diheme cytochrome c family protein